MEFYEFISWAHDAIKDSLALKSTRLAADITFRLLTLFLRGMWSLNPPWDWAYKWAAPLTPSVSPPTTTTASLWPKTRLDSEN